jgi:lipopolysaccharide/colanic/teichoic acid biosynthesis glycosyltransferase
MTVDGEGARGPDDPVETHRVTPLGHWLRGTRIDELPQLYNVARGEMSVIGPRPDLLDHARTYVSVIPRYRERLSVRPGISGLAQVRIGYAEGIGMTARKARLDQVYIRNACWRLEMLVLRRTLILMASGFRVRRTRDGRT